MIAVEAVENKEKLLLIAQEWRSRRVRKDSGRDLALQALDPREGGKIAVAFRSGRPVGATSWRVTDEGVKRINTGALLRKHGVGSALVRFVILANPGLPMWCKSRPEAWGFCQSLGMHPGEMLENGNRIFRWTAEEACTFI